MQSIWNGKHQLEPRIAPVQPCIGNTNKLSCQRMLRDGLPVCPRYDYATAGMYACLIYVPCANVTCKVGDVFALAF